MYFVRAVGVAIAVGAAPHAAEAQQNIVVPSGTIDPTPKQVSGTDRVTVQVNAEISTASSPAIDWNGASTDLRIVNSGIIRSTAVNGSAIATSGSGSPRTITLTNHAGALIEARGDALRIDTNPASGVITIDNNGTIRSTAGGQAIDMGTVALGSIRDPGISITNGASGVISSWEGDAIHAGRYTNLVNRGSIYSDGGANSTADGIRWAGGGDMYDSGRAYIENDPGATISGRRNGISADGNLYINNGFSSSLNSGSVVGRNGAGIDAGANAWIVNWGEITGQWDGVSANGDGDGIRIAGEARIINGGTIRGISAHGTDSQGRPNRADGVVVNLGSVSNTGTIIGAASGVLFEPTTASGVRTVSNSGTIHGGTDAAIKMVGDQRSSVYNSGYILAGQSGLAIRMGGGDDYVNVSGVTVGLVDGGAGYDTLFLGRSSGAVQGTRFGNVVNFEELTVDGAWILDGEQSYSGGIVVNSFARMTTTGQLNTSLINNFGTVIFDRAHDSSFSGAIVNVGGLEKAGAGSLTLGSQTYTGSTAVSGGTLILTGNLASRNYRVEQNATIRSALDATLVASGDFSLTNRGTVLNDNAAGRAVAITASANVAITNIGSIQSVAEAIYVNAASSGSKSVIHNSGLIQSAGGKAITLLGDTSDTLVNQGTIFGAVSMGGGNDTVRLQGQGRIIGLLDGGSGQDLLELSDGQGTIDGSIRDFELLTVRSGSWRLTGEGPDWESIRIETPGTLTGQSAALKGPITNFGTLIFDQPAEATVLATIVGNGTVIKQGTGRLTIGSQSYRGETYVNAGELMLAGSLASSSVRVGNGAKLSGVGSLAADLQIGNGGTISPGNGLGTISIGRNFDQAAGSIYLAETTAAGGSDRIIVNGTATIGENAILNIVRDGGTYTLGTRYTLLTAIQGISGQYTLVQNESGLTEFRLGRNPTAVFVDVVRTGPSLALAAATPNQAAVAYAAGTLSKTHSVYLALTALPQDAELQRGLDSLSGEVHASARLLAIKDSELVLDAIRSQLESPVSGGAIWGRFVSAGGSSKGAGIADVRRDTSGGVGGVDVALGDAGRIGVAGSYTFTKAHIPGRASELRAKSFSAAVYSQVSIGSLSIRSGATHSWITNEITRHVAFPGFSELVRADYDGNIASGFAEIGWTHLWRGNKLTPFAMMTAYRVSTDAMTETQGRAALSSPRQAESFATATLGIRGESSLASTVDVRARLGWQHALGDITPVMALRFRDGTTGFVIEGAPLSRDAATTSLDMAWRPTQRIRITAGYAGTFGNSGTDNRGQVGVSFDF